MAMGSFRYGHASASHWLETAESCLSQFGAIPPSANLGFLYVTDFFSEYLPEILAFFKANTPVRHWVGSVGVGICSTGREYLDQPAIATMLAELPANSFRVFSSITHQHENFPHENFIAEGKPGYFAIVHGDPRYSGIGELVAGLAGRMESGFLTGGLTSSRRKMMQIADEVAQGGLSGVSFTRDVSILTRLTQGCSPIGRRHVITKCDGNLIVEIDGKPALDVFKQDIGEVLARDLRRVDGFIFVGLPVAGSDTGDYLVRSPGIDIERKFIAVGELLQDGQPLIFCRRDSASAHDDMIRMLQDIKRDLKGPPKGGVYYSCLGRGEPLFGPDSAELKIIKQTLGDFPLVGFFANGEISHDRFYGYTGVLTLFT